MERNVLFTKPYRVTLRKGELSACMSLHSLQDLMQNHSVQFFFSYFMNIVLICGRLSITTSKTMTSSSATFSILLSRLIILFKYLPNVGAVIVFRPLTSVVDCFLVSKISNLLLLFSDWASLAVACFTVFWQQGVGWWYKSIFLGADCNSSSVECWNLILNVSADNL